MVSTKLAEIDSFVLVLLFEFDQVRESPLGLFMSG
jgi:hypothetical protein